MLCELCQQNQATTYYVAVGWRADEQRQNLCDCCYSNLEAEGPKGINTKPTIQPPGDVENIAVETYLSILHQGTVTGVNKIISRQVNAALEEYPATRQRLAMDLLKLESQDLDFRKSLGLHVWQSLIMIRSLPRPLHPEYLSLLEELVVKSFEQLAQSQSPPLQEPMCSEYISFKFTPAARVLFDEDPNRFANMLVALKSRPCFNPDARQSLIRVLEGFKPRATTAKST